MRLRILLTDDDGLEYGGEVDLVPESAGHVAREATTQVAKAADAQGANGGIDFSLGSRPFMKKYGSHKSGPRRFALLVAYLTKGDTTARVSLSLLEEAWNRMKPLMGGSYNPSYSTRAKDEGWVESPKYGMYSVRPAWEGIL